MKDYAVVFDAVPGSNTGIQGSMTVHAFNSALTDINTGIVLTPGKVYSADGCASIGDGKQSRKLFGITHGAISQAYARSSMGYVVTNSLTTVQLASYGANEEVKTGSLLSYVVFGGGNHESNSASYSILYQSYLWAYDPSYTRTIITASDYTVTDDAVTKIITIPGSKLVLLGESVASGNNYIVNYRTLDNSLTRSGISTVTLPGHPSYIVPCLAGKHGLLCTWNKLSGQRGTTAMFSVSESVTFAQIANLSDQRHDAASGSIEDVGIFAGGRVYPNETSTSYNSNVVESYDRNLTKTTQSPLSVARYGSNGSIKVVSNSKFALVPDTSVGTWDVYQLK